VPEVIVTSRTIRLRGARRKDLEAFLAGPQYTPRTIQVASGRIRGLPALTTPTSRMVRGGEKGMRDVNHPANIIADSIKVQSITTTPSVARRGGVISENQDDKRATTTVVMVTGPRVDALEVTVQWRDA